MKKHLIMGPIGRFDNKKRDPRPRILSKTLMTHNEKDISLLDMVGSCSWQWQKGTNCWQKTTVVMYGFVSYEIRREKEKNWWKDILYKKIYLWMHNIRRFSQIHPNSPTLMEFA